MKTFDERLTKLWMNEDHNYSDFEQFFKEELKKEHERGFIEGADLTGRLAEENKSGEIEKKVKEELKRITDSLIDDESLKDKSNGRYNREIELRNKIKTNLT